MSNQNNSDAGAIELFGFGALVIGVGYILLKFVEELFMQMAKAFKSFEVMLGSFGKMMLPFSQGVVLIAAAVGAIYFAYRYYKLVKAATDLRAYVKKTNEESLARVQEMTAEAKKEFDSLDREIRRDVYSLINAAESKIEELSKPASAKPPSVTTAKAEATTTTESKTEEAVEDTDGSEESGKGEEDGTSDESEEDQEIEMSNPY